MKTHYSAAELAAMKLPGLPGNERRMRDRAIKDGWASRQVPGKGGKSGKRTEYAVVSLPAAARAGIQKSKTIEVCGAGQEVTMTMHVTLEEAAYIMRWLARRVAK